VPKLPQRIQKIKRGIQEILL